MAHDSNAGNADKLWQLLVHDKLPEGQSTTGWLQNVLESIVGIGTSTKLRSASTGQRLQMARQVNILTCRLQHRAAAFCIPAQPSSGRGCLNTAAVVDLAGVAMPCMPF